MSFPRLCCSWHNSLGDLDLLLRSKSASRLLCTFQNLFFPSLYPSLVTVGVKMGTLLGAESGFI
ncbi:unnamed protein product [Brassica napus]|uniref:(rape) hypothetical protein n=1 Tax=Brassica napus TaxID=3708 RepID=A0A816L6B6_BRANA|nr:unnamed protein product [Brassica napus]